MNNFFKKYLILIINILLNINLYAVTDLSFSVDSNDLTNAKINCLELIISKDNNQDLIKFSKTLKYDLEFTDQLELNLKKTITMPTPEIEKNLFSKDTSLCLYILDNTNNNINITLKDLSCAKTLYTENITLNKDNLIKTGHNISAKLLPILTGEMPISQYYVAYSKMINNKQKNVCLADYACNFENTIISAARTINIAPSWHTKLPIIYYSQLATEKINLKSFNFSNKNSNTICSYDGINMQPSFSKDGSKVALCMSGGKNTEIYLYDAATNKKLNKKVFKQLTKNNGNNVSPCLLDNGNLIFCSDFQTGLPQIYLLDIKNNKTTRLTNGTGYCAAPTYCEKTNSITYTRSVNGTFQLFSLNLSNLENLEEKQLTFNFGNKHEPDISQCGRFVLFSYDFEYKKGAQTQQIAVLNINSGRIRVLTQTTAPKSFPKWSKTPIIA
ncbi:MAG: Protein TolB [candidate division TM6 bacterium GW2011_GWF2_28_16]|nr:MAG: Protein TolB [candidate division TM6 bacterium GW2011_GWF2_28_16]